MSSGKTLDSINSPHKELYAKSIGQLNHFLETSDGQILKVILFGKASKTLYRKDQI